MRTLIIEDNAELARLLAERLNARGIDSDIAGSIVEANDYIAVGQFDTIMLDLGLPDGDGIDWLRGTGSPSVARRLTSLRYSCVMPERSCPGNDWKAYFTALPIP